MMQYRRIQSMVERLLAFVSFCFLLCCLNACSGVQETESPRDAQAGRDVHEAPIGPGGNVPLKPIFNENRKIILNPALIKPFREGGLGLTSDEPGMISTLLNLSFVVGPKACDSFPRYFGDIADKIADAQNRKEFATSGYLAQPVHIDVLTEDTKKMPCIVGISTTVGFQNTQPESGGDSAARDYLAAIGYHEARAKWAELTGGKKVKVAVVDTGVDLDNEDIAGIIPNLPGADHVRRDNVPEDENGHGTAIASVLTAKGSRNNRVAGLGAESIEVLPIKVVRPDGSATSVEVANGIYRAINLGAEVINISVGSTVSGCDPIIGYAIEHGITRNVFFTISAGNDASLLIPARRDSVTSFEKTNAPACWALYFKGAMAVASLDSNSGDLASFSNYGTAVEIAAPGVGIPLYGLRSSVGIKKGTSFSAPVVGAAAALMIAAHKNLGFRYDPWLIEDRIINGAAENPKLANKIYKSRQLNMKTLALYIDTLKKKTTEERQQEPYNDPTLGDGYRYVNNGVDKMVRLELLTSSQIVGVTERAAVRARAYYASGSYFIVTPDVSWSSSDPSLLAIGQNGVLTPAESAVGKSIMITGRYQGFVTSITVSVNSMNDISGDNSKIEQLAIVQKILSPTGVEFDVIATFNDGSTRSLGSLASWSSSDESILRYKGLWNINASEWHATIENPLPGRFTFNPNLATAKTVRVTAVYRGLSAYMDFEVTPLLYQSGYVSVVTEGTGGGAWNHLGEFGTTNIDVTIVKGVKYLLRGNAIYQNNRMSNESGFHKGVWRSNVPGIKFDHLVPTGNSQSTLDAVSANIILDPQLEPGYYDVGFESSPFYPASRGIKFTVTIRLNVINDIATKIEIAGPTTAPWGKSLAGHRVFGTYGNGLRKQILPSELDFQTVSDGGSALARSWMEIRQNDDYSYLHSFDPGTNRDLLIKASHKTTGLSAEKKVKIYGLDNFRLSRQAAIPRALVPPQPRQEDGTCTAALKLQSPFAGGNGSAASPFIICSYAQFKKIPTVTMESCKECRPYAHYRQKAHLDLSATASSERFAPIEAKMESFYDGDGYEIQNLFIDERETGLRSLLGGMWVKIENLGIRKPNVRGSNHVAAILSYSSRLETMRNVYLIDGTVEGNFWAGGVVGYLTAPTSGTIFENIRVFGTRINGNHDSGSVLGGGAASQSISGGKILMKGIYSTALVANSGLYSRCIGGLVGSASFFPSPKTANFITSLTSENGVHGFTLADGAFAGSLTQSGPGTQAAGTNSAGGIIGCSRFATLIDIENTGAVTSPGGKVGGIAGTHLGLNGSEHGLMFRVRTSGAVTGGQMKLEQGIGTAAGGLVGEMMGGTIIDANVTANVSGVRYLGGFIGVIREFVSLMDSNFTGAINSANIENGGVAALNYRIKTPTGMPIDQFIERLQSTGHTLQNFYQID